MLHLFSTWYNVFLFVCWRLTAQSIIKVMSNRWVYVTTLFLGRLSPVRNWQLHCPVWISGRERMTVENVSCSLSMTERCLTWRGSSPRPPDHSESDVRRTEPPRPADILSCNCEGHAVWTLVSATCSFSSIGWPKWHILYAAWVDLYYFFCTPGFGVVGFRCGRVSVWCLCMWHSRCRVCSHLINRMFFFRYVLVYT